MFGLVKGCIGKIVTLIVLFAVAYAGWRWGPAVFPHLERWFGLGHAAVVAPTAAPTAEIADETLDRFERFRSGDDGNRMSLGGLELTSVIRYALPGLLPPGVVEPRVTLADGKVELSARVASEAFPKLPDLKQVTELLPDTVLVQIRGSLVPLDQNHLALVVDRVRIARVPLPRRLVPQVLDGLGRQKRDGAGEDALSVPLPDGLDTAFVERDSLVLTLEP